MMHPCFQLLRTDSTTAALLQEQLGSLGTIKVRRMFGGAGVYCDGVMFALIADDVVYLKASAADHPAFEAERLGPFTYDKGRGATATMSYWQMPERLLDDTDELCLWARRAIAASLAAKAKPQKPKPKRR